MFAHSKFISRCLAVMMIIATLSACSSYNKQVSAYYVNLRQGNYARAATALDENKLLNKDRNRLLYLLERGKVSHLLQQWDSSNKYFNEADYMMEDSRNSAKDLVAGTLLNPMMQSYKAEIFEKYLVHYYKTLNYLQLGQSEEALVEARRISIQSNEQEDNAGSKNKYSSDAFSLMLQGMIYERNDDINNAFIAYRNAVDVFLKNDGMYYGTRMPAQLKQDILRMASLNGFLDELGRYERLLGTSYQPSAKPEGGELIIFWENGSAPIKAQQDLYFSLFKGDGGGFFFRDAGSMYNVPFDFSNGYSSNDIKLENLRSFRVALPRYETQPLQYNGAMLIAGTQQFSFEPIEDINTLAFSSLKERMGKELSSTLTRLAVKKLAEAAVRPADNSKPDKEKSAEEKKKEEKQKNQREALALGLQLFNFASEKADTRNWQSLPHTIYYLRIPLQKGDNNLSLQVQGGATTSISVPGNGAIQFRNICTLQ